METIDMVKTAPKKWEADFVVEDRKRWFGRLDAAIVLCVYALIALVLLATGFR